MSKRITNIIVALVIGSSVGIGLAAIEPRAAAREEVSRLTPYQACEVTYINYPRRHWCDRQGHVHWR